MVFNYTKYSFAFLLLLLGFGCTNKKDKPADANAAANSHYTAVPIGKADFDLHKGDSLQRLLVEQFCEESKGYQKGTWIGLNKCSWAIEKYRLDQTPETIQRNGEELSILLQDGKKLSFIHQNKDGEQPILFQLKKYLPDLGYVLIEKTNGENCTQHLFVSLHDGQQLTVDGTPYLSPDKKSFILNGGSKECHSTLEYWTLGDQQIQQKWTSPLPGGAFAELRWLNEKSFVGSQRTADATNTSMRFSKYNLF